MQMTDEFDQSAEYFFNQLRIGNLPYGIANKDIENFLKPFGRTVRIFMKRRASRNSPIRLLHPYAFIIFESSDSVDRIMAARPLHIQDCQLFIRRCLPITEKYPNEAFVTVTKILIRSASERNDESLPNDKSIIEYLRRTGGRIESFERIDNKTMLVQFDDYDSVDLCCLSRPHRIENQLVEIEKFSDNANDRLQIETLKNSHSNDSEYSPTTTQFNMNNETRPNATLVPTLSIDDKLAELRLQYKDRTDGLQRQHEQLATLLSSEWRETAKERIRFQRLTLDYKQELERLEQENRQWQKSFSDSLREKPIVQKNGEHKLEEASKKTLVAVTKYDVLKSICDNKK